MRKSINENATKKKHTLKAEHSAGAAGEGAMHEHLLVEVDEFLQAWEALV